MRKTVSLFILFAGLAITASAQQPKVADRQAAATQQAVAIDKATLDTKATAATNDMDKSLSLTKEQRDKVFQINRHLVELEARLKTSGKTPDQVQQDVRAVKLQLMMPVLTEKQSLKLRSEATK